MIRVLSQESASRVKQEGLENDLLDRIRIYKARVEHQGKKEEKEEEDEGKKEEGSFPFLDPAVHRHPDLFEPIKDSLDDILNPHLFTGRSEQQVRGFLAEEVAPLLARYAAVLEEGQGGGGDTVTV